VDVCRAVGYVQFLKISILQGSVATHFRCGGIFNYHFIANSPLNVAVKNFKKLVNNTAAHTCECSGRFFLRHPV